MAPATWGTPLRNYKMKLPYISEELIEFLDKSFPERSPELSWSDREIWIKAGERRLVRYLIRLHQEQLEKSLIKSL